MNKAFDVILQEEVNAIDVAKIKNRTHENRFRYQCLWCGEEVYLAAADSKERSPHFRHKRGNNDIDCERFLRQPDALKQHYGVKKGKREHIEFYFNREKKIFEIGVFFAEKEFVIYEKKKDNMTVFSKEALVPFLSIPLNKENFILNDRSYFTITEFSTDYLISYDSESKYYYRNIMRASEKINIFRIKMQDEHCLLQKSSILYTNTQYIAISENKDSIEELSSLEYVITLNNRESFVTQKKIFYELSFSIKTVESSVQYFFQKNDYQIKSAESFNILWPPTYSEDSRIITSDDMVYVYSSFELVPHENINTDVNHISKMDNEILKIYIEDEVAICEKNVNINIQKKKERSEEVGQREVEILYADKYKIPDENEYFLFDKNGCTRLSVGSTVYLCETDKIIGYKNGHVKVTVYRYPKKKMNTQQFIDEVLKYHPQSEPFNPNEFMDIPSDENVITYLENCYRSGKINTVLKRCIKEEQI